MNGQPAGFTQSEPDMEERGRLQRAFQARQKCGIRRRDLLHSTGLSLADFNRAVAWFIETGQVKSWTAKESGPKPTVYYQWVGEG